MDGISGGTLRQKTAVGIDSTSVGRQQLAGVRLDTPTDLMSHVVLSRPKVQSVGCWSLLPVSSSVPYWLWDMPLLLRSCIKHVIKKLRGFEKRNKLLYIVLQEEALLGSMISRVGYHFPIKEDRSLAFF